MAQEIMGLIQAADQSTDGHVGIPDTPRLVCFISESCEHCDDFTRAMKEYSVDSELPTLYCFVLGETSELEAYRERFEPNFTTLPIEALRFFRFIGRAPPRFYLISDERVVQYWDGEMPEPVDVLAALAQ
jgi:hypothetical protein